MATITVLNTNDSGAGSLRQAIADASAGDTIVFDSTLAGGVIELESELVVDKALIITGPTTQQGGPGITLYGFISATYGVTYTGWNYGDNYCRGMRATASLTLSNVIFDTCAYNSGGEKYGGGLFCDYRNAPSAVATINNCVFQNCFLNEWEIKKPGVDDTSSPASYYPSNYFPPYPDPFIPAYGGYVAIYGGTAILTDCQFWGQASNHAYGGGKGDIFAAFDAAITMTGCNTDSVGWRWAQPYYFNNCAVSFIDQNFEEGGTHARCHFDGGTLALNNAVIPCCDFYSDLTAPLSLSGYNQIGVIYGALSAISGTGYLGTSNGIQLSAASNNILMTATVNNLTGTTEALTFNSNGETLIEKKVGSSWQKVGITPYPDAGINDSSQRPQPTRIPVLGVDPDTGVQVPYFIPNPSYPETLDPRDDDHIRATTDPNCPYIPNPQLPANVGYSLPNPSTTTFAITTTERTTYRVWDGFSFQLVTVVPIALSYTAPNTITASWTDETHESAYEMTVVKTNASGSTTIVNAASLAANATSYVLSNVDPNYRYSFTLCAHASDYSVSPSYNTATLAVTTFTGGGETIAENATLTTSIGYGANVSYSWSGTASSETTGNHAVTTADITPGRAIVATATPGANTVIVGSNGAALQSATVTFSPNAVSLGALNVAYNNNGGLDISWADTPNESSYTLAVLTNNATLAKSSFTNSDVVSGQITTSTNNNLAAGLYTFQLTATNDAGSSTASVSRYLATMTTSGMSVGGYTYLDTLSATLNYGTAIFRWYLGSVAAANLLYETPSAVSSSSLKISPSTLNISPFALRNAIASGQSIVVVATPASNTTISGSSTAEFTPGEVEPLNFIVDNPYDAVETWDWVESWAEYWNDDVWAELWADCWQYADGCSLRQALFMAAPGDTISLFGEYLLGQFTNLDSTLVVDKAVIIDGVEPSAIVPDPDNPGQEILDTFPGTLFPRGNAGYGLYADSYENGEVGMDVQAAATIRGVCFCLATSSPAVRVGADGVVFERCTFFDNSLAVLLLGSATFNDCKFIISGCNAITSSGAIFCADSTATDKTFTFNRCTFEINGSQLTATSGIAAIKATGNNVVLNDCTFKKYTSTGNTVIYDVETQFGSTSFDNVLTLAGVTALNNGYKTDYGYIETTGFGGISTIVSSASSIRARGTGYLAVPSSVSFTDIANTVTRCAYGAGASKFVTNRTSLSWTSADATKTVLLLRKNGSAWDMVNAAASSPVSNITAGTYAIFDGVTFRTRTVTSAARTLVVTNTNDSGAGSLRAMIAEANSDDTITFDPSLTGQKIILYSQLEVETPTTIVGPTTQQGAPGITLNGFQLDALPDTFKVAYWYGSYLRLDIYDDDYCRGIRATDSLTLSNVAFENCLYYSGGEKYGGELFCDYRNASSAVATITNCAFCNREYSSGLTDRNSGRFGNAAPTGYGFPADFYPPLSDPFIPAYGGYVAIYGGTAILTDCSFGQVYNNCFGGGKGDFFAAFDATITLSQCEYGESYNWKTPFYFNNCDVTISSMIFMVDGPYLVGGELTLSNVFALALYVETALDAPIHLQDYNSVAVCWGNVTAFDGNGYLFSQNAGAANNIDSATTVLLGLSNPYNYGNPSFDEVAATDEAISFYSESNVLIEKQVGSSWQKVGVSVGPDNLTPTPHVGDIVNAGLDPETGEQIPYFIPDPSWSEIPDPRDLERVVSDPSAYYIPNPDLPDYVPNVSFAEWGPTTYEVETVFTTTYRVWDGLGFLTYTVQGEDPPEPDPPTPPEPVAVRPGRRVSQALQMTYENESEAAIPAGTPVLIGSAFGVAEVAIPAGATGVISILGTWIFPCADTTVASMGDVACWDDTNKVITTAPSGSSAGLTAEYNAVSTSGGTVTFSVADSTGWAVGDLFHIDDDEWTLEVTATTATTIKGQYVVQPQGYLEPDTGTLVQEVETPDVLPVGAFVNAVTSGETTATVMIFPAAPVNGESSSSEESGGGD